MRTSLVPAVAALAFSVVAIPAEASAPGYVTKAEFKKVKHGMTRARVEHIFDAGRGCVYLDKHVDGVHYLDVQYPQKNGAFTGLQYNDSRDGKMRARAGDEGFKDWNLIGYC